MEKFLSAKILNTAAYYYAFIILGLITGIFGPTLTALAARTQSTLNEISIIFAVRSFGYLVGSLVSGKLFDRLRGHPLIAASVGVTALAFVVVPLIPFLWVLTLVVFILGLAEGGIDVGGNSLLAWIHGNETGPYMNGLHFFFGVGAFISPIIVAQVVVSAGDIAWAYWVLALIALPSALGLTRLPSPAPHKHAEEHRAARANRFIVAATIAFFFLYAAAEVSYGNWIFTYATRLNLTDAANGALLTSGFWGAFTLGRLLGVPLSMRLRPAAILLIDLFGAMASVALVLALPQSLAALWLGTFGAGVFLASLFPTMIVLANEKLRVTGEITSWFLIGAGGGAMLTPWLIGQLFEPLGAQIAMGIVLASLVGTLGAAGFIMNVRKKINEP